VWDIETPEAMKALASRLAAFTGPADCIALYGDMGAGKTAFAQGLLPALGVSGPITSPTYGLVHSYEAPGRLVFHCDFYRLQPGDEEEIGFLELCANGLVIAEWPDSLGVALPPDRLEVRIEIAGANRRVSFKGLGDWERKLRRFEQAEALLNKHAWSGAQCTALKGDASARLFSRLERESETRMLMDWPPQSDGPPIRNGLPYCAIAHLAREGTPFIAVSDWLRSRAGLSAPRVIASDRAAGLYLVEDLGDGVFGELIAQGEPLESLYTLAADGLLSLHASKAPRHLPAADGGLYEVPAFDREALEVELELVLEWYFKLLGLSAAPSVARKFFTAWAPYLDWIEDAPRGLVLRDYHSPNLLLCEGRDGLKRLGVIDFQDAVWGHPAYDLVSLLQDARLEVPRHVETTLFERYCAAAAKLDANFDKKAFRKAYAILGAQRNTKIIGIFARLSVRDGKHRYLAHLPRISGYLNRNLNHPALKPLAAWYKAHLGDVPSRVILAMARREAANASE
jgi:tRNA threonylcarbamoyl adenosine modification protein YjeE